MDSRALKHNVFTADSGVFLAARVRRTAPSASAAAGQKARELAASGKSIVNLTVGEPDFETPERIRKAAKEAIDRGDTRYTTVTGTPALKNAIIRKFATENGLDYAVNEIIVGSGAKHLIFNAFLATVEKGDEVIVPAPYWVSYPEMVRFAGGEPVIVKADEGKGFKVTAAQIEAAITPKTRWLVLNSPGNPSGAVYSAQELKEIGEVLLEHPHVLVLTDDIYEHLIYSDAPFTTIARATPQLKDRVLTVNGVSKAYCMTGWRIGYAGGPKWLIAEMGKIQSQSTGNPSSISQAAAVEALLGPQDEINVAREQYRLRRDFMCRELNAIDGIRCIVPDGAFYVFPDCQAVLGKKTAAGTVIASDNDFVLHLLDHGVAAIGGEAYGFPGYFRVSIAASKETLSEGCRRIRDACNELK